MKVVQIATSSGIDDIKLIAENPAEEAFLKQLAEAGTLTSLTSVASSSLLLRPITVQSLQNYNNLISRGIIGKYDFELVQNQDFGTVLTFINNGNPLDLSLYNAIKMQVKSSRSSTAVISLEIGSGLTISGPDNNILSISISADQTKLLCEETYYYDILFASAIKTYYVEGKITIKKTRTR